MGVDTDSPWKREFKLADFGLSHFKQAIANGFIQPPLGRDTWGSADYGEIDARQVAVLELIDISNSRTRGRSPERIYSPYQRHGYTEDRRLVNGMSIQRSCNMDDVVVRRRQGLPHQAMSCDRGYGSC